jgi:hypothetical protein
MLLYFGVNSSPADLRVPEPENCGGTREPVPRFEMGAIPFGQVANPCGVTFKTSHSICAIRYDRLGRWPFVVNIEDIASIKVKIVFYSRLEYGKARRVNWKINNYYNYHNSHNNH